MRCVLWLHCVLCLLSLFATSAELQRSTQNAARDIPLDESEGDLPPLTSGDANGAPRQRWSLQKAVKSAEEDLVNDPEAGSSLPDEMTQTVDPTEVRFQVHPLQPSFSEFPRARKSGNRPSLIASKRGRVSQMTSANATRANFQTGTRIVQEFDVVENGIPMGIQASHGRVVDGEMQTAEDRDREQIGDYDKVVQPVRPSSATGVPHIPQSLAHTRTISTQASRSVGAVAKQKPGPEKMKAQCMSFANYLKAQDVQGPELIRMWKGSCDPIVASGNAGPSFGTMCSAMGGALEPYVMKQNWPPDKVCDAVLRIFNEAGIGV